MAYEKSPKLLKLDTATTTIETNTETSITSYSIPGNLLGTNKAIHLHYKGAFKNSSGAGRIPVLKVKLGATVFTLTYASITSRTDPRHFLLDVYITNNASASSQIVHITTLLFGSRSTSTGAPVVDFFNTGTNTCFGGGLTTTATEDTTSAKTLDVTWTNVNTTSDESFQRGIGIYELIN
jgi:hypothetical protein